MFAAVAAARITWIFRIFSVISTPTKMTPRAMFFITATIYYGYYRNEYINRLPFGRNQGARKQKVHYRTFVRLQKVGEDLRTYRHAL